MYTIRGVREMLNKNKKKKKKSLRQQLIGAFLITSITPLILLTFLSYFNSTNLLKQNIDKLIDNNLQQTVGSLGVWLESYEDLLYQLYTDDNLVVLVDKINRNEDVALSVNQMRRTMRAIQDSKDYIESITIITKSEKMISTDVLNQVTTGNSWMSSFSLSQQELYSDISSNNLTHYYPTEFAATFANQKHYLFHMAHRIIDYKDIMKQSGVVIVSINEKLLNQVCSGGEIQTDPSKGFNFIVDENGRIISFYDQEYLSNQITKKDNNKSIRQDDYKNYINSLGIFENRNIEIHIKTDENLGWDIVNVSDQSQVINGLNTQRRTIVIIFACSILILAMIIFSMMIRLTRSIDIVVNTIRKTGSGNMKVSVPIDEKMPSEIEIIASTYNTTVEQLRVSISKEKKAIKKQKDAEIAALEAQINPHFLYNTLDTVNWMAIDKDEYEISNAISSLAMILRYAIDRSNQIVTVKDEIEWLKKYIYLQQTRLKNTFQCNVHVEPQILNEKIHKLLLQPFVENAIIHGFEGEKGPHYLTISIEHKNSEMTIRLQDNGKGMKKQLIDMFNAGDFSVDGQKSHIGIMNAISRIQMYYGEKAKVHISSVLNQGTIVEIHIATERGINNEDSDR
jgi:two-component system sensor histidine kinase YesM